MINTQIRNIAIIAHVDHGKTTLLDFMLKQAGIFRENERVEERVMDSIDLERERGIIRAGSTIGVVNQKGEVVKTKITALYGFQGLKKIELPQAVMGDIVAIAGIENANIGDTVTDAENPKPLPRIAVDEPTISMVFSINTAPFAGKEGKFVTSRHLKERLEKELLYNV